MGCGLWVSLTGPQAAHAFLTEWTDLDTEYENVESGMSVVTVSVAVNQPALLLSVDVERWCSHTRPGESSHWVWSSMVGAGESGNDTVRTETLVLRFESPPRLAGEYCSTFVNVYFDSPWFDRIGVEQHLVVELYDPTVRAAREGSYGELLAQRREIAMQAGLDDIVSEGQGGEPPLAPPSMDSVVFAVPVELGDERPVPRMIEDTEIYLHFLNSLRGGE